MIKLDNTIVPPRFILDKLGEYQTDVDANLTFEARSAEGKKKFSARNKKGNKVFDAVKKSLTAMCSGARRCVYCEDSVGDEVEHFSPKDLYPEKVFRWDNYVYACGNCNGPKNNKFAVFHANTGAFQTVNPPQGQPAQQPPAGDPALINPRVEDPLAYCMLDLAGTFKFVIIATTNTREYKKADYTYNDVLRLNHEEREFLRQAREEAYGDYKARLSEYVQQRDANAPPAQLQKMIAQLKKKSHPTVWKEMQRYRQRGILQGVDSGLDALFIQAPEALTW
jgi:uncharacterized protein (TIGR02646 family)